MQELVLHEVVAPLILGAEIDEHVYATDAALSKAVVSTHLPDVAKPLWLRGVKKKAGYTKLVEIGGGAGEVSRSTVSLSLVVAPPLDLTYSEAYNLEDLQLLSDILDFHMVKEKSAPKATNRICCEHFPK